jgi:hypothetical protein
MTPTPGTDQANVIDLTGLPAQAVEAVRSVVEAFRKQATTPSNVAPFSSREEWVKAVREWASSHKPEATEADWSRESIYAGRGE